jgi:hypothetical protein
MLSRGKDLHGMEPPPMVVVVAVPTMEISAMYEKGTAQ